MKKYIMATALALVLGTAAFSSAQAVMAGASGDPRDHASGLPGKFTAPIGTGVDIWQGINRSQINEIEQTIGIERNNLMSLGTAYGVYTRMGHTVDAKYNFSNDGFGSFNESVAYFGNLDKIAGDRLRFALGYISKAVPNITITQANGLRFLTVSDAVDFANNVAIAMISGNSTNILRPGFGDFSLLTQTQWTSFLTQYNKQFPQTSIAQ
jgi:hypothetical protein